MQGEGQRQGRLGTGLGLVSGGGLLQVLRVLSDLDTARVLAVGASQLPPEFVLLVLQALAIVGGMALIGGELTPRLLEKFSSWRRARRRLISTRETWADVLPHLPSDSFHCLHELAMKGPRLVDKGIAALLQGYELVVVKGAVVRGGPALLCKLPKQAQEAVERESERRLREAASTASAKEQ